VPGLTSGEPALCTRRGPVRGWRGQRVRTRLPAPWRHRSPNVPASRYGHAAPAAPDAGALQV